MEETSKIGRPLLLAADTGGKAPRVYERTISVKLIDHGEKAIHVLASLQDIEHSFQAEMIVDVASGRIEQAIAVMARRPYETMCLYALDTVKKLEGQIIGRGINRRIVDLVGKTQGCVHLVEIFQAAVGFTATILIGRRSGLRDDPRKTEFENRELWFPVLKGSCQVFREDAPATAPGGKTQG
ncbi:MAG: DUF2889 domain-containing protein [Acidobacteriia bacterium]|nr:DUF2889 domain-containing protein [Terriglobia bacterium]